jgi:cobalamin biosynthesis Mg chelatase CobN
MQEVHMPEGKRFSHIAVNAAEDDDIVIVAGAPAPAVPAPVNAVDEAPGQQAKVADPDAIEQSAPIEPAESVEPIEPVGQTESVSEPTVAVETSEASQAPQAPDRSAAQTEPSASNPQGRTQAESPAQAAPASDQGYREQTLEDLEAAPMSSLQKKVLAAVLIFGIAGIVFYIVRYVL